MQPPEPPNQVEGEETNLAAPLSCNFRGACVQNIDLGEVQVTPDEEDVMVALLGPGQRDWIAKALPAGVHHGIRAFATGHGDLGSRCGFRPRVRQWITRLQYDLLDVAHEAVLRALVQQVLNQGWPDWAALHSDDAQCQRSRVKSTLAVIHHANSHLPWV